MHRLVVELVAGARECGLDPVEAREHPSIRPHEGEKRHAADDDDPDGNNGYDDGEQLSAFEVPEPRERTRLVVSDVAGQRDDRERGEHAVAGERLPACRRRVQLAEAVAVGRAPAREADADGDAEDREEHERADRAVRRRFREQEQPRDRQLREWQEEGECSRRPGGRAELADGLPRALSISKLRERRDREHGGENDASCDGEWRQHFVSARRCRWDSVYDSWAAHARLHLYAEVFTGSSIGVVRAGAAVEQVIATQTDQSVVAL